MSLLTKKKPFCNWLHLEQAQEKVCYSKSILEYEVFIGGAFPPVVHSTSFSSVLMKLLPFLYSQWHGIGQIRLNDWCRSCWVNTPLFLLVLYFVITDV